MAEPFKLPDTAFTNLLNNTYQLGAPYAAIPKANPMVSAMQTLPATSAMDPNYSALLGSQAKLNEEAYRRATDPTGFEMAQDWAPTAFGAINTIGGLYGTFGSGGTMDMNKANIEAQKANVASLKQNMADKAEFKSGVRSAFA